MKTFLLLLLNLAAITAIAAPNEFTAYPADANYAENAAARTFIHTLAVKDNMDEASLLLFFAAISRDDSVLEKISRPAEKTKPWHEYEKIFDDQARFDSGQAFYAANKKWFDKAYADYGVDSFIIAGILGVETRYGKVTGKTGVLSSLATLCFDYPPRSEFFCSELENFLKLAQRENWNPLAIQGSYAGAMGMGQFMPSSYLNDAIDFDGDGRVDLWNSSADAIGSIANYLKKRGWQKDGGIVQALPAEPAAAAFDSQHEPHFQLQMLAGDPNLKTNEKFISWLASQPDEKVGSLILQGEKDNLYYLTYNNFNVITRYNTSPLYAMAVNNLAQRMKKVQHNQESPND